MLISIIIGCVGVGIAWLEVPTMWKNKHIKELWLFFLLLIAGVTLNIMEVMRVPIPNPIDGLIRLYGPIGDAIMKK